jgi:hypothetical protein
MQDARTRASPSGKHSMLRAISHRRRVVGKRQVVCVERERRSLLPVDEYCRNPILLALQVLSLSLFCALSSVLPARRVGSPSHVTDDRDADLVTQAPRWTPQLEPTKSPPVAKGRILAASARPHVYLSPGVGARCAKGELLIIVVEAAFSSIRDISPLLSGLTLS